MNHIRHISPRCGCVLVCVCGCVLVGVCGCVLVGLCVFVGVC